MPAFEVILRLTIAVLVGGAFGYEREYRNRPAGFKTHILVCLGATVIALIQVHMNEAIIRRIIEDPTLRGILSADYGRLSAQVISGIGFLGAGTIIHNKGTIRGLTTAATLWVVATIGLAIGYGYYFISVSALIIAELVLILLKKFQKRMFHAPELVLLDVEFNKKKRAVDFISQYFEIYNIQVANMQFSENDPDVKKSCIYTLRLPKTTNLLSIIRDLSMNEDIYSVRPHAEDH